MASKKGCKLALFGLSAAAIFSIFKRKKDSSGKETKS